MVDASGFQSDDPPSAEKNRRGIAATGLDCQAGDAPEMRDSTTPIYQLE